MKLTDTIHLLKHDFVIQIRPGISVPRFVNSLVIFGEKIQLIDTGIKTSYRKIFDYIRENNRKIEEIERIILSHSHPDHIGSAAEIKRKTGCSILAHENEKAWIEDINCQAEQRPVPAFFTLTEESVKIDQFLTDRQRIRFDNNIDLEICHTPGHSKGSLSILFREDEMLFCADAVPLEGDIPNYDNYQDLKSSLGRIKKNRGYKIMLTSWAQPVFERLAVQQFIEKGEKYLDRLNQAVISHYTENTDTSLESCRQTISALGLPDFFVNSIVDKAFRSHLT